MRLEIASIAHTAQTLNMWGAITNLSKDYSVSRNFIYELLKVLKDTSSLIFAPSKAITQLSKKDAVAVMLHYRMIGRCSLESISELMKIRSLPFSGLGTISEMLSKIGNTLPSNIKLDKNMRLLILIASDEVFSKSTPILITVDPISSAILKIEKAENRKGETWKKHFDEVKESGISVIGVVRDEGNGLALGAKESLPEAIYQVDSYHAIAHRFGELVGKLEKRVNKLKEADVKDGLEKNSKETEDAIELSDNFSYLYYCIINELKPFCHTGEIRNRASANGEIETALELMQTLGSDEVNKRAKSAKKVLPNLLNYFEQTKKSIEECQKEGVNKDALEFLSLAWQWGKAVVKAKDIDRKHRAIEQRDIYIYFAKELLKDEYESISQLVFGKLELIIQASSMVECINSILRPYLNNSKNNVSQGFLNLFMFYHNHRRYRAGKRKGSSPMELLTRKEQKEEWVELLMDSVEEANPSFFL
ncbi:hypothetical protein GSY74_07745 [Sulfurovum sp. bin170]|uniref:transposase n=1 Tax=Sulfurovum sp. bin170 TaxID=2695268 RepID=UPI0013DF6CD8|nr:transposase [Sulfurovum sp. bin170]NEW61172.1 hypothetical protein [Sulfurovum sp. bin170]